MKKWLIYSLVFLALWSTFLPINAIKRKKSTKKHFSKKTKYTEIKIEKIPCINQSDQWKCGYFAIFNLIQMLKASVLDFLKLDKKTEDFKNFIKFISKEIPNIAKKYNKKEWLSTFDVEKILTCYLSKSNELKEAIKLTDISIITEQYFDPNRLPIETIIRSNILDFRKNSSPKPLLILKDNHWTAHVFTMSRIYTTNSLPSFNKNLFPFLRELHKYFSFQNMPNIQTIKSIQKKISYVLRKDDQKKLTDIKTMAIKDGFSEQQFDYMLKKIRTQIENQPTVLIDLTNE